MRNRETLLKAESDSDTDTDSEQAQLDHNGNIEMTPDAFRQSAANKDKCFDSGS